MAVVEWRLSNTLETLILTQASWDTKYTSYFVLDSTKYEVEIGARVSELKIPPVQ